jgi:hypothetical protein
LSDLFGIIEPVDDFVAAVADEKPVDKIFIIPVRIEDVDVPKHLSKWHWVNLFEQDGYQRLIESLKIHTDPMGKDP